MLAKYMSQPSIGHVHVAKNIIKYLMDTQNMGISFTTTLQTTLQSFVQLPTDTNKQQFSMSNANWGLQEIKRLSPDIQREWLAASKKELKFIIENPNPTNH